MNATESKESNLEIVESVLYGHAERAIQRFNGRLLFSQGGFGRLLSIFGWIAGVKAGNEELATKLADDIIGKLEWLSPQNSIATFPWKSIEGKELAVQVPSARVVLHDDGSFNSFGVCWYHPVDPNRFAELQRAKAESYPDMGAWNVTELVDKDLNIARRQERIVNLDNDLTVTRYFPGPVSVSVPYRFSYNGGLIYHGPAAGQTFTVSLSNCLWGIHT